MERLRAAGCVFAEDEAELLLTTATPDKLEQMVQQRTSGVPLEQVLGWAEFGGLRVEMAPGVFVPRRRTELLLRHALMLAPPQPVVVELCCGSAALALALAWTLPQVELYAADIDPVAVQCARQNLAGLPGFASVLQGDLYEPLPHSLAGRVDLLPRECSICADRWIRLMPPEARLYEPRVALDGGADGLDVVQRIIARSRTLARSGWTTAGGDQREPGVCGRCNARVITKWRAGSSLSDELDATAVIGWRTRPGSPDNQLGAGH